MNETSGYSTDISHLVAERVEALRPKLLDLTRRNPLLNTRFSTRSTSVIRIIDELPDQVAARLTNQQALRFLPLPPLGDEPPDELTPEFQNALSESRLTNETYLSALEALDPNESNTTDKERTIESTLRDHLRSELGLEPRQTTQDVSPSQHALRNGISPNYDLPSSEMTNATGNHGDEKLQTLLFAQDLERKLNGLVNKSRTWEQENGVNVLHSAFGFLQWQDPKSQQEYFAPLVLLPVKIERTRSQQGTQFFVTSDGDDFETNIVLATLLERDFGISLPQWSGGSVEEYFNTIQILAPENLKWQVRRQIAFGVFPSAKMSMFDDIDPTRSSFISSPIVTKLLTSAGLGDMSPFADDYDVDRAHVEAKVPYLVLDADASQFSTIVDVSDGINLSVEGPPGTGKSQTIVNSIAAAMAQGKKVLFVAEKNAALEVVRSRLEAVGLGEFLLTLQATRSTRQEVIDSIRERLALKRPPLPASYDRDLTQYRRLRTELQTYLNVLSSQLGETGLSVHEILGRSIQSADTVNAIPASARLPREPHNQPLTPLQRQESQILAERLSQAWRASQLVSTCWRGLGVRDLNRLSAFEITDQAIKSSVNLEQEANARQRLEILDLSLELEVPHIERLLRAVLDLINLGSSLDATITERIFVEKKRGLLLTFIEACREYKAFLTQLQTHVHDPGNLEALEKCRELLKICQIEGISILNPFFVSSEMQRMVASRDEKLRLQDTISDFIARNPSMASLPLSWISIASDLLHTTGQDALDVRSILAPDPTSVATMRRLLADGRRLRVERNNLTQVCSLDIASEHDLRKHAATLQGTGMLKQFSSEFKSSRRVYAAIAGGLPAPASEAAALLLRIAKWQEEVDQFSTALNAALYPHTIAQGLDTDFDLIEETLAFYGRVDISLPLSNQRELRDLISKRDATRLMTIPLLPANCPDITSIQLREVIVKEQSDINTATERNTRVQHLAQTLRNPQGAVLLGLERLVLELEQLQLRGAELDLAHEISDLLGTRFAGRNSVPEACHAEIQACGLLTSLADDMPVVLSWLKMDRLEEVSAILGEIIRRTDSSKEALGTLDAHTRMSFSQEYTSTSQLELAAELRLCANDQTSLMVHSDLSGAREDFDGTPYGWLATELESHGIPLDDLSHTLAAVQTAEMATLVFDLHGSLLSRYRGTTLNEIRSRFAELDRTIIKQSRLLVRSTVAGLAYPPPGIGSGRRSEWTEMALINNEAEKKKRHISVRDLTHRAGQSLLEIKPCWMMSPMTVAQYLPQDMEFDLCIIDEASQMPPVDALGALSRCKQVMVVGDTNQLPPTTFFRKLLDDEDADDEDALVEESILELANSVFRPARRLRWHYRSQDPSLIQFSNEHIYDNNLVVFPSASQGRDDMGVKFVPVAGEYKGGCNHIEANEMVEWAIKHILQFPDRSLGIVTLNRKQQILIQERWNLVLRDNEQVFDYDQKWKDGLESFFIKNLESVQGDERDVIFVGTVYGPAKIDGPVMQRFGPVNGVAGKRRLNVLFSRAKQQMITFSSLRSEDIKAEESSNPGAFLLKQWLEYSATGRLHGGSPQNPEPDSEFEVYVIEQIRSMGCEPVPQVGVQGYRIDIGVRHPHWPHGFIMGVECDGASYHSSRSARDRDRLREDVLRGLGWNLHRIWSTDWFNDPVGEVARLRKAIEDRLVYLKQHSLPQNAGVDLSVNEGILAANDFESTNRDGMTSIAVRPSAEIIPSSDPLESSFPTLVPDSRTSMMKALGIMPYFSDTLAEIPAPLAEIPLDAFLANLLNIQNLSPERFFEPNYIPVLSSFVSSLVDNQGPITFKLASEITARAHGWQRTGSRIKKQVWAAVSPVRRQSKGKDGPTILWPQGMALEESIPFRGLVVGGYARQWSDVPYPEKLGLALATIKISPFGDPVATMAGCIGLERIRNSAREELIPSPCD